MMRMVRAKREAIDLYRQASPRDGAELHKSALQAVLCSSDTTFILIRYRTSTQSVLPARTSRDTLTRGPAAVEGLAQP